MATPHKTPGNAKEMLHQAKRLMASPAYYQSGHVDHQKVAEVVTKIYQTVYGTGPAIDPVIVGQPKP